MMEIKKQRDTSESEGKYRVIMNLKYIAIRKYGRIKNEEMSIKL